MKTRKASGLSSLLVSSVVALLVVIACGERPGSDTPETPADTSSTDTVATGPDAVPAPPLEVALEFSNLLAMNDRACYELLLPSMRDSFAASDSSPSDLLGTWRGFDASGRLTDIVRDSSGIRTSYYCSIVRAEGPPIVRIDFTLVDGYWRISGLAEEMPSEIADSLTLDHLAELVLDDPSVRLEMRLAHFLLQDIMIDSIQAFSSMNSAIREGGTTFEEYIVTLSDESYAALANSNIRRSGKIQIIQDRATYRMTDVPLELANVVRAWREMAYTWKAVLRAEHEAMQELRQTGVWSPPEIEEEMTRLRMLRSFFLGVSNLVEERDTLARTVPVLLTSGLEEPLRQIIMELDPHMIEQRSRNELGVTIWRALGVEMNGDNDPERVVYWSGDLFLFEGKPNGYRLVLRTYEGYDSDYHSDFMSQPSDTPGCRCVNLVGNEGVREYVLTYVDGRPVFGSETAGTDEGAGETAVADTTSLEPAAP